MTSSKAALSPTELYLRTEFPRRLAHALRTPLGVVSGVMSELRSAQAEGRTIDASKLLDLADRSNRQLERIAERLSLLAHLQGERTPNFGSCDLGQIARDAVDEISAVRPRRRVVIEHAGTDAPCPIRGDASLLRSAVGELVDNAVRFARERVVVGLEPETATVSVRHDGTALDRDVAARSMAPFSPSEDRAGLGIGLAIASLIASAHAGSIEVRDGVETSAVVLLHLPECLDAPR